VGETKKNEDWRIGNTNNQKYDKVANTSLSLRVNSDDTASWQAQAKTAGKSLNHWVIDKLNVDKQ